MYVGLDVHRKRTQVAILDEEGAELLNRNVQNDPMEIAAILGSLDAGTSVAFEAAHIAKRRPPFSRFFAETAQRRGRKIATVAVARKLLARAFRVLKEVEFGDDPSVECARFESCA